MPPKEQKVKDRSFITEGENAMYLLEHSNKKHKNDNMDALITGISGYLRFLEASKENGYHDKE